MRRAVLLSAVICNLLAFSSTSRAAIPPVLRPGTHPMWASLGMGPALNANDFASQFKLIETFGYHFTPNFGGPAAGPAIAFDLQEAFGSGFTSIELGPKFVWDIPIVQNLGLYLSPMVMLGYAWAGVGGTCVFNPFTGTEFCTGGGGGNFFDMQFGFEGKLILGDRGMVFFRPFGLDILINGGGAGVRYDMIFGGGVIF